MTVYSPTYATISTAGDFGIWISKLVLALPGEVGVNDVDTQTFNVFCSRRLLSDGSVLMRTETGADHETPSEGYVPVLAAYPADEAGAPVARGTHVALELPETRLTKRIEGGITSSQFVENRFRITQLKELPAGPDPVSGLVFETCTASTCPQTVGWHESRMSEPVEGIQMEYGYFEPSFEPLGPAIPGGFTAPVETPEKAALLIWLHGAGEGGNEVGRAYLGNRVTALSQDPIQRYFGGAAWVLVPQCPTFWMDDGVEAMSWSNQSIYVRPLKALIDEFVAEHADRIDTGRIVIAGLSNGGFMTVRMCADYPEFFAAGIPTCAPFFVQNQTPEVIDALVQTPLWFVHSKGDELVDPTISSLPLYHTLKDAGAEVHMTYFDHVEDLTGVYHEPDGRPLRTFNHGVWIHVYNDFCRTDLDGTNVMIDGEPVGVWEWAAHQRRA